MLSDNISPGDISHLQFLYLFKNELLYEDKDALIYKGYDSILQRNIAAKFLRTADIDAKQKLDLIRTRTWLSHPNILEYYGALQMEKPDFIKGDEEQSAVILMEYAGEGNLYEFCKTRPSDTLIRKIFIQVLEGLTYLHQQQVVHGNLKSANIQIGKYAEQPCAKVSEFGQTNFIGFDISTLSFPSNIEYLAPEILDPADFNQSGSVPFSSDFWSFGVILYEFFTGQLPFGSRDTGQSVEMIMHDICKKSIGTFPESVPQKYADIIRKCLVRQPLLRVSDARVLISLLESEHIIPETVSEEEVGISINEDPDLTPDPPGNETITYRKDETLPFSHRIIDIKSKHSTSENKESASQEVEYNDVSEEVDLAAIESIESGPDPELSSILTTTERKPYSIPKLFFWFLTGIIFSAALLLFLFQSDYLANNKTSNNIKTPPVEISQNSNTPDESKSTPASNTKRRISEEIKIIPPDNTPKEIIPEKPKPIIKTPATTEITEPTSEKNIIDKATEEESTMITSGLHYSNGLAAVQKNGKWGFVNKSGATIIQNIYDEVQEFNEGFSAVLRKGKWGYVDNEGVEIVSPKYDYATAFINNMAAVSEEGKWGFIDVNGVNSSGIRFDYVQSYSEGMAGVSLNGLWGFIDKNGALVIHPQYSTVKEFTNGTAKVTSGDKTYSINRLGACVSGC